MIDPKIILMSISTDLGESFLDAVRYDTFEEVIAFFDSVKNQKNSNSESNDESESHVKSINPSESNPSFASLLLNFVDEYGKTALHIAAANGNLKLVTWLLSLGAVQCPNESGNTPLHWAALNGHMEVSQTLVHKYGDAI